MCQPVSWEVMEVKLEKVLRAIRGLGHHVSKYDNLEAFHWLEGEEIMREMLAHPQQWSVDGCSVCAGLDFIYSWAGLPFMVGLCIVGDWEWFDLSLEAVKVIWGQDGDHTVAKVTQWIMGFLDIVETNEVRVVLYILEDWVLFERCLEGVRLCWGVEGDNSVVSVKKWIEGLLNSVQG